MLQRRTNRRRCCTPTRRARLRRGRRPGRPYTRRVQSLDLTEALFAIVERQRVFVEKVYARCVELEYPKEDLLRQHAARAVLAQRELCLVVNGGRQKGVYRQYLRRSKSWPTVEE
jgi:hypothetical protein